MKNLSFNVSKQGNVTGEELLEGMYPGAKYDHLRIIVSNNDNREFGQKYLLINHLNSGYGLIQLINVEYEKCAEAIKMKIKDLKLNATIDVILKINEKPSFVLISWDDILKIESENK
jgi:hypothetical protein